MSARLYGAARLEGKSRTDFMLEAPRENAERVLLDQTLSTVTAKQCKVSEALMNAPLAQNAGFKRLLANACPGINDGVRARRPLPWQPAPSARPASQDVAP